MKIELMKEQDIAETQKMIEKSVRHSFPVLYPQGSIEYVVDYLNVETLKRRMTTSHFSAISCVTAIASSYPENACIISS